MGVVACDRTWDAVFPRDLVPKLFDVVCEAWLRVGTFGPNVPENRITQRLIGSMRSEARRRLLPVWIDPQYQLLGPDDEIEGILDITVRTGEVYHRYDIYFAFECKRLNVTYPSGFDFDADKYCDRGIVRYVNEQYAQGLGRGGMIGYVMDRRCKSAIDAVERAMCTRAQPLRIRSDPPLQPSSLGLADSGHMRDSRHTTTGGADFTIHHIFLEVEELS